MKDGKEKLPYRETPFCDPVFGEPEDCIDIINKYGTYNVQPTVDGEYPFPFIAQGLPAEWIGMRLGKREAERQGREE